MKFLKKTKNNTYIIIITVLSLLCLIYIIDNKNDYTLKFNHDAFPDVISNFYFYKISKNEYQIKFDELLEGIIHFENDSIAYIEFDNNNNKKLPFFIKGNTKNSIDTITVSPYKVEIVIEQKTNIDFKEISNVKIKYNGPVLQDEYDIWFSFKMGIIQVIHSDGIIRSYNIFYPKQRYYQYIEDSTVLRI